MDSYDEYYDYDYYTGSTYSDYSSTARYEDILYHYTPYNTHMEHSVRFNDTEISPGNGKTSEKSSNVSVMISEAGDDVSDDNVTSGVSDDVDIALDSDDTETTVTEDEPGDKLELVFRDIPQKAADVEKAEGAFSYDSEDPGEDQEAVSQTTVQIVPINDESDDIEDTQISATFYQTISETAIPSEISKEDDKNVSEAEISSNILVLSFVHSEEDSQDSSEEDTEIEDNIDSIFSTEANTAEVSAIDYIVDEYHYEQEVTLDHPITDFEDIEEDDVFSSSGLPLEVFEISGSGEILEEVSSSGEFKDEFLGDTLDEYMEESSEKISLDEFEDKGEENSGLMAIVEEVGETSTPINIAENHILDYVKEGVSRHPKLISSWQEKSYSSRQIFLSCHILLIWFLSLIFIIN